MATVVKPFNTAIRRFRVGAAMDVADDLSPHTFGDLKERGFIADDVIEPKPAAVYGSRFGANQDAAAPED